MPMVTKNLILFCVVIIINSITVSVSQDITYPRCDENANFTRNGTYQRNLDDALSSLTSDTSIRRGAQFYYPSCNVRYEDYRFFNNAVVIAPPSPPPSQSSLSPPSPPPGGNEAIVVRLTSMMLPAFVAWLPRLSLSSSVIPIRNVDWYMFRGDVRSSGSRAPCGRVQAMLPADRLMSGRLRFLWAFGLGPLLAV
ncbi:hypothetical protein Tco_1078413 [Tanacetum coccineum]|uniref:Uncharacterized protein n=1 Tax=Tanacetum coccineum TaxID=301880 RepID=A0ABQ5HNY9_9ASTR